jgi:hypothetical protein
MGIFDQPTSRAASWDEYAKVVIGFNGNSFVFGTNRNGAGAGTSGAIKAKSP